jgi:muramidase (phage lysozyme)
METSQSKTQSSYLLGLTKIMGIALLVVFLFPIYGRYEHKISRYFSRGKPYQTQPLVMKGGDPYIRALMRTITASEANVSQPYNVIYGGQYVKDLSVHPNKCVTIIWGPNRGKCSTAAGRYQFLNSTWSEKAAKYHPKLNRFLWWKNYSFEPEYQDEVVYKWLKDKNAWGVDISHLLQHGKIDQVFRLLSNTWTSLGYGIETNSMSEYLPEIYQQMLQDELSKSS